MSTLDVVHPAFPLLTTASATLQGAPQDGFGEAVVARDMPEPFEIPSLDNCRRRFLWANKEVDLAPHPVVGLVLRGGDADRFPPALGLESLYPFLGVNRKGPCLKAVLAHIDDKHQRDRDGSAVTLHGPSAPDSRHSQKSFSKFDII